MHVAGTVLFFSCLTLAFAEGQLGFESAPSPGVQWVGRSRNGNGIILLVQGTENGVDAPSSFWATRGKKDPLDVPFWAARGKKNSGTTENMEIPFWAARGKRDGNRDYFQSTTDSKLTERQQDGNNGEEDVTANGYFLN